jgi:rhodanese-related sulfurtransferase
MDDAEWATYGTDSIVAATNYVVDVRAAKDYDAGHIENAISVPTDGSAIAAGSDAAKGLDAAYSKAKNEGKRIVFICYSGNRYARRAMDYVYNTYPDEGVTPAKVTYLKGGFNNWKTANPYVIGKVKVDPAAKTATIKAKVNAAYLTADAPFIYHLIKSEGVGDKDAAFVSEADVFDFHSALTAIGSKPWSDTSASLETGQTLSAAAAAGVGSSTFSHYDVTVGEKTLAEVLKYKKNGTDDSPESALDMAFSGNYENQLAWKSGCIACLQSCPAGIATNNAVGFMTVNKETDYFCLDSAKLQAGQEVAISFKLK